MQKFGGNCFLLPLKTFQFEIFAQFWDSSSNYLNVWHNSVAYHQSFDSFLLTYVSVQMNAS